MPAGGKRKRSVTGSILGLIFDATCGWHHQKSCGRRIKGELFQSEHRPAHIGCFCLPSVPLFADGLKHGQVIDETDEFNRNVVSQPVSVTDLRATICAAVGINPAKELYNGHRPGTITDHGNPQRLTPRSRRSATLTPN